MSGGMETAAREAREVAAVERAVHLLAEALTEVYDPAFGTSLLSDGCVFGLNRILKGTGFQIVRDG